MKKTNIFDVGITDAKKDEILEYIITGLEERDKKLMIFTPNPEIVMFAQHDNGFKKILNEADIALNDGIGLVWAAKMLGKQLQERITGVDFMEDLCNEAAKNGFTIGLLGGKKGIAEGVADCLLQKYPGLKISYFSSSVEFNDSVVNKEVSSSKYYVSSRKNKTHNTKYIIPDTDILFVALGFPRQEKWIYENLPKIDVRVAMAVGGAFDYISGNVLRAPLLIRNLGLEWLFRLIVQPWRLKRQLALPKFLWLVFKERLLGNNRFHEE